MILQQLCDMYRISLDTLAERAGVPVETVRKIDSGEIRAQAGTLGKLARALDMRPTDLAQTLSKARRRWGPQPLNEPERR